jgi:hypothetical protein
MFIALNCFMRTLPTFFAKSKVVILASLTAVALSTYLAGSAEAREDRADEGSNSKTVLAFDLDFVASLGAPGADIGGGGALRLGRKMDLILVSLTPEIGGSYDRFNGFNNDRIYRGFIGGRLGFGKIIEPSVFAHIGVGRFDANVASHTAPVFDAGIALDLTFLPLINLGAHASYNTLFSQGDHSSFNWLALGLHVALVF